MADYLVQEEDGVSRFTLEDGSGFLLLEALPLEISRAVRVVWDSVARRTVWTVARRIRWRRSA